MELIPAVPWIESRFYDSTSVNTDTWDFRNARFLKLAQYQKRILNHILTPDKNGIMPYRTVIWSEPKKSGKTTIAGAVAAWWADQIEAPNLILCVANDQEQSAGRIFAAMGPTLYRLAGKFPNMAGSKPVLRLPNGTTLQAIPNKYEGEAGANYGATFWSELWAFCSERGRRLFDELVPVPTRKNSIRWIETYAGYEDEADLLIELFKKIFTNTREDAIWPGVKKPKGLEDLPCYVNKEAGLFMFWSHELRMPWQTSPAGKKYYQEMRATERRTVATRFIENRWQPSEGGFLDDPAVWWERVEVLNGPERMPMILAGDASQRNDCVALVGITPSLDQFGIRVFKLTYCKVWNPEGSDIDLNATMGAEIRRLAGEGLILGPVWIDPYQLHQMRVDLINDGIACEELNQGEERTRADTFLYSVFRDQSIQVFGHPVLRAHVAAAKAKELDGQRLRLIKGTLSEAKKIDGAVTLSMAVYRASEWDDSPSDVYMEVTRPSVKNVLGI